jgi:ProP effector
MNAPNPIREEPSAPGTNSTNALAERLRATFPVFSDAAPLAIGIHKAIRERLPDVDAGQLRLTMKRHTSSTRYLKALATGETRLDLDGQPAGSVTPEQREQAAEQLRERFKRNAERRREEQREEQRQREQEQRQREHQEKLLKLADRFKRG